jgi:sterol desaturase/sphingolipid hydroxylase (fatty acid hydroxylase superfamily)
MGILESFNGHSDRTMRVHHAFQLLCDLDKKTWASCFLIIWDKMFGTFQPRVYL